MTTRPRLRLGTHLLPGLLAVALFVVLAAVFLRTTLDGGQGFESGVSITASIGYAMFDLAGGQVDSNGFLAAFEIVDFVLVAALVGAVMLARREDEDTFASALRGGGTRQLLDRTPVEPETDGGERVEESRPSSDVRGTSDGGVGETEQGGEQ
jgi:NADH-quinone oxidoreductase subunit J